MLKITIISVGKLKEKYWKSAMEEYAKRLGRYCSLNLVEVADEKCPENISPAEQDIVKEKEGEKISRKIPEGSLLCTLEIAGKALSSEQLASWIEKVPLSAKDHICFVIGGSLGLSPSICRKSSLSLSFSAMTFPHQMMRVILLEQIYRAHRISRNEPYHK
ncbi:MAG: 23S rRNA (pseudouridine(1915)-N(3))-methyltransferase RlmH [Spirochaetaceae bacterium 4572_59]|nr:MAG: 23S rRNA (pseudouridine(1915)-N(3))-methyltransferase RlmH [Spirochaetaceae bacterium 4572_59]